MDFNGDGYLDLIVGERNGYVNFFSRKSDGTLTEEPDISANRAAIDVGENSAPCVVDWNDDGLLDLVIGNDSPGNIRLYLNSGTTSEYQYTDYTLIQCDGSAITYNRCNPHVADLNLDGKKDIIIGEDLGFVYYLENVGTNSSPEFSTAVKLQSEGSPISWPSGQTDVTVWINDWNEDGTPDLLLGNYVNNVYVYIGEPPSEINPQVHSSQLPSYPKSMVTKGIISLNLNLKKEQNVTMKLFSSDGRLIMANNSGVLSVGENTIGMNLGTLSNGLYFIHYTINNQDVKQRIVFVK